MVTFIVVILLAVIIIAFAILLIVKKGKLLKRWYISFGSIVLAGIICIATAVPVTSNKVYKETEEFVAYFEMLEQKIFFNGYPTSQSELQGYDKWYGSEIAKKNAWLDKWKQTLSSGVYWDVNKTTTKWLMGLPHIPYVVYENGEYVMKEKI